MVGGGRSKADHVSFLVKFVLRFGAVSDYGVGAFHVFRVESVPRSRVSLG